MAKKRSATSQTEEEEENEEQDEVMDDDNNHDDFENDDDDDDDTEDGEEEDEGGGDAAADPASADNNDVKTGYPSSTESKDMRLRSGKRKRRRSKETTGLTPPTGYDEKQHRKKRVRTDSVKATKPPNGVGPYESSESHAAPTAASFGTNGAAAATVAGSEASSPDRIADPRRISFSLAPVVVAPARKEKTPDSQEDEEQDRGDHLVLPKPGPALRQSNVGVGSVAVPDSSAENDVAATERLAGEQAEESLHVDAGNGVHKDENQSTSKDMANTQNLISLLFMLCLALLGFVVGPGVVKVADFIIPLDAGMLPQPPPKIPMIVIKPDTKDGIDDDEEGLEGNHEVEQEIITEVLETPSEESKAWNRWVADTLTQLEQLKNDHLSSTEDLISKYNEWNKRIQRLRNQLSSRQQLGEDRLRQLSDLEDALNQNIDNYGGGNDPTPTDQWGQLRAFAQRTLGVALLSMDSIDLWEVSDISEGVCGIEVSIGDDEEVQENGVRLLSTDLLETKQSELLLRAQMTAEKFITGGVAEERIREWIKMNLDKALDGHVDALKALSCLKEISSGRELDVGRRNGSHSDLVVQSLKQVQETILQRLEIDRADLTGVYDHASLMNGAVVLYGGKRGTSKSLIDGLPIINRVLQQSRFRFYGFGPEAALSSTYPRNALGQCWSFHQTTLNEQLKERELNQNDARTPDDFKRGNFGTLTIGLPKPVWVSSVVIEHPPMSLTDQADSAIRNFRVVGYEDAMASSIAWNLGSFQYDIQRNRRNDYLQEFEVQTTVFGKEVPALQSISLAVDSNWGHDYACLYRFRVHGEEKGES